MTRESTTRRRGKALEEAIYQAVWDELQEHGFDGLTMDGIAKRAGTSKPVLYRRWNNRIEILTAAVQRFLPKIDTVPDQGSLRANTVSVLWVMRERMRAIGRATMLGLFAEIAKAPEWNEPIRQTFLDFMIRLMTEAVIVRAIDNGEIEFDQITNRIKLLPLDLARMEFILTGDLPDESIIEIVDQVFVPAIEARRAAN